MNKLLYISTCLPKEEVDRLREKQYNFSSNAMLPISVFHGNILDGLTHHYDEICALSGVPIHHRNYRIVRYGAKTFEKGKIRFVVPGFFNLPVLKQLAVTTKLWWQILAWYRRNRKHNCHIIIDGTFYSGLLALYLAGGLVKANNAAILVDYYSFMDPCRDKLSQKIYYRLLKKIRSFVFVTDHLEKLVNEDKKPYVIMEGLVAEIRSREAECTPGDYCLYAGGLHEIYGIRTLVDAFHASKLRCSLHLYGNGDQVDYIRQMSLEDPRIQYMGILDHDRLLEVERGAKLLVNPRPVRGKLDTRFNFPSKLMEFMQSGRPVLTTRLLGIPPEYEDYMYFFEDDTQEKLTEKLEQVLSLEEKELSEFGLRARAYVNENKNSRCVGGKLFALLNREK